MVGVKICGVCRREDAAAAAAAGASHVGVILAPGRTRSQSVAEAGRILEEVSSGAGPRRVGVFVDAPVRDVVEAALVLDLDAVQLHGDESVDAVERIRESVRCEVWKAIRVRAAGDALRARDSFAHCIDALLLDGWSEGAYGGAGVAFDWSAVAVLGLSRDVRLIAAGGLTPDNVAAVVSALDPAVVDVSSGVEAAPGEKAHERIRAFIAAARGAEVAG